MKHFTSIGSQVLQEQVVDPNVNFSTCYPIPKTNACNRSLLFIFPESCSCPIFNSSAGLEAFQSCTRGCKDTLLEPVGTERGEICFSDLRPALIANESLFHFVCLSGVCKNSDCLLRTIVTSHAIIFAGMVCIVLASYKH